MKLLKVITFIAAVTAVLFGAQKLSLTLHLGINFFANHGLGQVLLYVITLGGVAAFINFVWKRSIRSAASKYFANSRRAFLGFLFASSVTLLSCVLLYAILIACHLISFSLADAYRWTPIAALNVAVAIFTGATIASTEEIIFRGFLFNYLRSNSKSAPVAAMIGSAVIFALLHKLFKPEAWLHFGGVELLVGLSLLGMALAATYWITRSLAMSAGVHAGVIWAEIIKTHTNVVHWHHNSWLLGSDHDVRTSPIVWLLFLAIPLFFYKISPWIAERFTIEGRQTDSSRRDKKVTSSTPVGNLGEAYKSVDRVA